ncbi:MAG: GxxExxY protein [Chitinophagaceae bacterium]|nr:GxxExxY protein [Chitinophagaceae bacterium]MDP1764347.1 GxxExxY protein [Sediminibacterium sp.]
MAEIILKEESYRLIGICMEVHRQLGMGFKEIVYKDALEIELMEAGISFQREKLYKIGYKDRILRHKYCADFIVYDSIILEVKSTPVIVNSFIAQTINYLKASGLKLGIIANFGERSFSSKRVVF